MLTHENKVKEHRDLHNVSSQNQCKKEQRRVRGKHDLHEVMFISENSTPIKSILMVMSSKW